MLNHIRAFFNFFSRMDRFLREPQLWTMNGFTTIYIGIILIGVLASLTSEILNQSIFEKPFIFLFGSFIYSTVPYLFFKSGKIKKYIFFGEYETIEEVIRKFNSKAYAFFVIFFSYMLLLPIFGIPLLLKLLEVSTILSFIRDNIVILIYTLLTVTSVVWFSYHIVNSSRLQKIKIKVALYTAVGTTVTLIRLKQIEQFSIVISCLLVSYLWVQYLIEIRSEEIELSNDDKDN
ncbi:hypothetical protein [Paenibacillus dendritiformis]|uniref:hypothetical protein n=1 Tax=Paenibacillus dendritiformis TaxID=130049 RepID=UPI000DA70FBF|nr:hypothetical protein [Paenibacillus dendritiformis]PZM62633.1 hypothetical protein DOE73_25960 [Paenibacillus dendritiformis]